MRPPFPGGNVKRGTEEFTTEAAARGNRGPAAAIGQKVAGRTHTATTPSYADNAAAPEQQHSGSTKRYRRDNDAQQQTPVPPGCGERLQQRGHQQIWKRELHKACVQQRQRQDWFQGKPRRKVSDEWQQQQHPMVHFSPPQELETRQGRWMMHCGDGNRVKQQEPGQLRGEAGSKGLPEFLRQHRLDGQQQLLQRGSEDSVRKRQKQLQQQQRQHHERRNVEQQCYPPAPPPASRWSAGATAAAPSMMPPRAGASALNEGRSPCEVEVQQNFSQGWTDMTSSGREFARRDRETCSSNSNRKSSCSGELRISSFGESSSPCSQGSEGKANARDSGKENSESCGYNRRWSEECLGRNTAKASINRWEMARRYSGEDGAIRHPRSNSSRQEDAHADEREGATSTEEGSSEHQLRKSCAPWIDYDSASESAAATGLTSSSNNHLELNGSTAARRASAAPTSPRAIAVLEKTGRTVIGEQQGEGRSWAAGGGMRPTEDAEVEGAAAAKGTAATASCRTSATADVVVAACSSGASTDKRRSSTGDDKSDPFAVADAAAVRKKGNLGIAAEGRGEEGCGTEEEKERQFCASAAAGAADNHSSPHVVWAPAPPPAAAVMPPDTTDGRSTTTAEICFPCPAMTVAQNAVTVAADAGSMESGTPLTAAAKRSCNSCGCCSYCRSVEGGGATGAKRSETEALPASAERRAQRERGTLSQGAAQAGSAASGPAPGGEAAGGAKKPPAMDKEEGQLRAHLRRVEALNEVLLTNISSLYKTAKAELDRKDATIAEKDRQIGDLRLKLQECTGAGESHQEQRWVPCSQGLRRKHQQPANWQRKQQQQQQPKVAEEQQHTRLQHPPFF